MDYILDHDGAMEDELSGWGETNQYGGNGEEPSTQSSIPWSLEERTTTAIVLGLEEYSSDEMIVREFRRQMLLNNWATFVIAETLMPIKRQDAFGVRMDQQTEGVFKYFWLISMSMEYGKHLMKVADPEIDFNTFNIRPFITSLLSHKENDGRRPTFSFQEAKEASIEQSELKRYICLIDYTFIDLSKTIKTDAIPLVWPCQLPNVSYTSFLKYYFFEIIHGKQSLQTPYCIVPLSLLTTVKYPPHQIENRNAQTYYEHDISHMYLIMTRKISFHGVDLQRVVNFLFKKFEDDHKKIIQFWCSYAMFELVHELLQSCIEYKIKKMLTKFVCPLVHGGWNLFFNGYCRVVHSSLDVGMENNMLERMFLAKSVLELQKQVNQIPTCVQDPLYMSMFMERFHPESSYVDSRIIQKLFGEEQPVMVKHIYPTYAEQERMFKMFDERLFTMLNCLVKHTEFDASDTFDWEFDWEVPGMPLTDENQYPRMAEELYKLTGGNKRRRSRKRKTQKRKRRKTRKHT